VELQRDYGAFQNAGAEVVALAVAPLASVNAARQTVNAAYPMLADPNHQVAEAYGVYDLLGDRVAAPSVFIIDANGTVVWRHVGRNATDRPNAQEVLGRVSEAVTG
jgi:peroxiredoxin